MQKRAIKHIVMEHMFNLRDLGGYETIDGKMIGWHRLFRGDSPFRMTQEEWSRLKEIGLRTVIDLRSDFERQAKPVKVIEGINYEACPLQRDNLDIDADEKTISAQNAFLRSLTEGYLSLIDQNIDLLVIALKAVKKGLKEGGVLFHCTAGKDRTGVLAAVLLYLCGVEAEDIIADYQVSCTYNKRGINTDMTKIKNFERLQPLLNSNAENMEKLLEHFKLVNIREVLKKNGLTEQEIEEIRSAVVE